MVLLRITIPFRTPLRLMRFRLTLTLCPAIACSILTRLRCIVFTVVKVKCPSESGPSSTSSPTAIFPDNMTPDTTVPTKGTEKASDLNPHDWWVAWHGGNWYAWWDYEHWKLERFVNRVLSLNAGWKGVQEYFQWAETLKARLVPISLVLNTSFSILNHSPRRWHYWSWIWGKPSLGWIFEISRRPCHHSWQRRELFWQSRVS